MTQEEIRSRIDELVKQLNAKRQLFFTAYCVNPDATDAALKSGYAKTSARVTGHKITKLPVFIEAYQLYQDIQLDAAVYDGKWKRSQLVKIHLAAMLKESPDFGNAMRSIDILNKMDGDYDDKSEGERDNTSQTLAEIVKELVGSSNNSPSFD